MSRATGLSQSSQSAELGASAGSIIYSTFSGEWLARNLLPRYEIEGSVECILYWRGMNDTYLVRTAERKFALRVYRVTWRTLRAVQSELSILQTLRSRGVPLAAPVPAKDGVLSGQIQAPEGVRLAALFDWAEGTEPRYDEVEQAHRYGRLLAELHDASDDLRIDESRPRLDIEGALKIPLQRLKPALTPEASEYFDELGARITARLAGMVQDSSTWGFCHGDPHFGNVRASARGLTWIDFDCCAAGWRAFDLATFRWAARGRGQEQTAWPAFLEAYLRQRPAARQWAEVIPSFVIMRHLWLMGLYMLNSPQTGAEFYLGGGFAQRLMSFCASVESEDAAR